MFFTKSIVYASALTVALIIAIACLVIFVINPLVIPILLPPQPTNKTLDYDDTTVYFFYGEGCPHCANVEPIIHAMEQKYPAVQFMTLEIWINQTNRDFYDLVNKKVGYIPLGVPEVVVGYTVLTGDKEIPSELEGVIINQSIYLNK